jgi:hypothetical protein
MLSKMKVVGRAVWLRSARIEKEIRSPEFLTM